MVLPVKIARGHGVLEFWSIGVLEKAKPEVISLNKSLHCSITPPLHYSSRLPHEGRTIQAPCGGGSKPLGDSLLHD